MASIIEKAMAPKSDQLNADDLIVGPIDVTIVDVTGAAENKIAVHIGNGRQPWKPCKTMLRLLTFCWGSADEAVWIGKSIRLYRDPNVKYGSDTLGGIRVSHASDITETKTAKLTVSRGKREAFTVQPLKATKQPSGLLDVWRKRLTGAPDPVKEIARTISEGFTAKDPVILGDCEPRIAQIQDETWSKKLTGFLSDVLGEITDKSQKEEARGVA
jgi:hypothetical protein